MFMSNLKDLWTGIISYIPSWLFLMYLYGRRTVRLTNSNTHTRVHKTVTLVDLMCSSLCVSQSTLVWSELQHFIFFFKVTIVVCLLHSQTTNWTPNNYEDTISFLSLFSVLFWLMLKWKTVTRGLVYLCWSHLFNKFL